MFLKFCTVFFFASYVAFAGPESNLLKLQAGDKSFGNKNAKITVIIYDSYSCGHCARFYLDDFSKIEKQYIKTGKILFIRREYPLDLRAMATSKLMNCTKLDDIQYHSLMRAVFSSQDSWVSGKDYEGTLRDLFAFYGLPKEKANDCLKDESFTKKTAEKMFAARSALDINGTPAIFVNGEVVEAKDGKRFEALSKAIDSKY